VLDRGVPQYDVKRKEKRRAGLKLSLILMRRLRLAPVKVEAMSRRKRSISKIGNLMSMLPSEVRLLLYS